MLPQTIANGDGDMLFWYMRWLAWRSEKAKAENQINKDAERKSKRGWLRR